MRRGGRAPGPVGGAPSLDPNTLGNITNYWDPAIGYVLTGSDKYTDLADQITASAVDLSQATDSLRPLSVIEPLLNNRRVMKTVSASPEWLGGSPNMTGNQYVHYIGVLLPGTTIAGSQKLWHITQRFGITTWTDQLAGFVDTTVAGYHGLGAVLGIGVDTPLLTEIIVDGSQTAFLVNGVHGASSPTANTDPMKSVALAWMGAGHNGATAGMAGMKYGPQALFTNTSSGTLLSSGDRTLLLAQWNSDLGTSFT